MKKTLCILISFVILISCFNVTAEENTIKINLDGNELAMDVTPTIIDGRTLVPFRAIIEAINGKVDYDEDISEVFASYQGKEIRLILNDTNARVKQNAAAAENIVKLDVPAKLINDRTLVPVRFMAESFELFVGWNEAEQTVIIIDPEKLSDKLSNCFTYMPNVFGNNGDNDGDDDDNDDELEEYVTEILGEAKVEALGKSTTFGIDGKCQVNEENYKCEFSLKTNNDHIKFETMVVDGVSYTKENEKWIATPNILSGTEEAVIELLKAYPNPDSTLFNKVNSFIDFICQTLNSSVENLNNEFTIKLNSKPFIENKDKLKGFITDEILNYLISDFDLIIKGSIDNKSLIANYNVELNILGMKINLNIIEKATITSVNDIIKPI